MKYKTYNFDKYPLRARVFIIIIYINRQNNKHAERREKNCLKFFNVNNLKPNISPLH